MSKKARYITTTLPYANGAPHIGHAVEFVRADAFARYSRLVGHEVFFNTGLDEHGKKNLEKAVESNLSPQEYVDRMSETWRSFCDRLEMKYDFFSRTTADHHKRAVQEFWEVCDKRGYIYKDQYQAKYCVGCEMEKTDSELVDGYCPDHPNKALEHLSEENYFFKFSKLQEDLLTWYKKIPAPVDPDFRLAEIEKFVSGGLRDFSISRTKEKMPWGISVPGDDEQVIYVWFDALPNYISCLGWPEDAEGLFERFWNSGEVFQFCGKDNLRPQTAMWQGMLFAANVKNSDRIFVGGHIISGGKKMSKTIGNVIDPLELLDKYGVEATRYLLLRHVHPFDDSDITWEKMDEWYTAHLVNGYGNLVARIMKLAETHLESPIERSERGSFPEEYTEAIENFRMDQALDYVWKRIGDLDEKITTTEPFKLVKVDKEKGTELIQELTLELYMITRMLSPFMPETNRIVKETILANKKPENLFPRLNNQV